VWGESALWKQPLAGSKRGPGGRRMKNVVDRARLNSTGKEREEKHDGKRGKGRRDERA
jgi:hypothetical protein